MESKSRFPDSFLSRKNMDVERGIKSSIYSDPYVKEGRPSGYQLFLKTDASYTGSSGRRPSRVVLGLASNVRHLN
ncbi:hypothetical protein TNCV_3123541 [Trichonephila clavipes]|nr:hypothetical protein TNCV_3123541 [Trichonephila clavipes]